MMKFKIIIWIVTAYVLCSSVCGIDVANHSFETPNVTDYESFGGTVTEGWWFVTSGGIAQEHGGLVSGNVPDGEQCSFLGWHTGIGNHDLIQDIPGPTINDSGSQSTPGSVTPFEPGKKYTITWWEKQANGTGAITNRILISNRDAGMGTWNETILDSSHEVNISADGFTTRSLDFTPVGRTNRIAFRLTGFQGALAIDNITIISWLSNNWSFEMGTYHGWTVSGDCWGGAPVTTNFEPWFFGTMNTKGRFYANSRAGGEAAVGYLQSRSFILEDYYGVAFLIGGYSRGGAGPGIDYNYVTLNLADDDSELARVYAPGMTPQMEWACLWTNIAFGKEVYIKAVDDATGNAYAWFDVDAFSLASPFNGFESGSYGGWKKSGTAFGMEPSDDDFGSGIGGWNSNYYALSLLGGETAVGSLRSEKFVYQTNTYIQFLIGGYSRGQSGPGTDYNYVTLNSADNGSELDRKYAPGVTATMSTSVLVAASLYYGKEVYIEVVDDCANGSYAWLSVDEFEIVIPEPVSIYYLSFIICYLLRFLYRK